MTSLHFFEDALVSAKMKLGTEEEVLEEEDVAEDTEDLEDALVEDEDDEE